MRKNNPDSHPCGCCGGSTSQALVIIKPEEIREKPPLEKETWAVETAPSPDRRSDQGDTAPGHDSRRPLARTSDG